MMRLNCQNKYIDHLQSEMAQLLMYEQNELFCIKTAKLLQQAMIITKNNIEQVLNVLYISFEQVLF